MLTPDDRPTTTTHTTSSRSAAGRGPVRVLIIDDNPSYADLLTCALDTIDDIHCVGTATSAAEGFARLTELDPTVVMMDLMMPGLDGLAATRQLRQLSPDTAVAVVSAHSDTEWIARAEDAGASAYIPKGGSLTELIDVLRAATPGPMIVTPSLHTTWPANRPTPTRPHRHRKPRHGKHPHGKHQHHQHQTDAPPSAPPPPTSATASRPPAAPGNPNCSARPPRPPRRARRSSRSWGRIAAWIGPGWLREW